MTGLTCALLLVWGSPATVPISPRFAPLQFCQRSAPKKKSGAQRNVAPHFSTPQPIGRAFQDGRNPHAASRADGDQAAPSAPLLKKFRECGDDPCTGRRKGMAER